MYSKFRFFTINVICFIIFISQPKAKDYEWSDFCYLADEQSIMSFEKCLNVKMQISGNNLLNVTEWAGDPIGGESFGDSMTRYIAIITHYGTNPSYCGKEMRFPPSKLVNPEGSLRGSFFMLKQCP